MERSMIGVNLLDKKRNAWMRGVTKVKDIRFEAGKRKAKFAVKLVSMEGRWARTLFEWNPPLARSRGYFKKWSDEYYELFDKSRILAFYIAKYHPTHFVNTVLEYLERATD